MVLAVLAQAVLAQAVVVEAVALAESAGVAVRSLPSPGAQAATTSGRGVLAVAAIVRVLAMADQAVGAPLWVGAERILRAAGPGDRTAVRDWCPSLPVCRSPRSRKA